MMIQILVLLFDNCSFLRQVCFISENSLVLYICYVLQVPALFSVGFLAHCQDVYITDYTPRSLFVSILKTIIEKYLWYWTIH